MLKPENTQTFLIDLFTLFIYLFIILYYSDDLLFELHVMMMLYWTRSCDVQRRESPSCLCVVLSPPLINKT